MPFLFIWSIKGQITIQGIVRDADNLEVLIGATVLDTIHHNWAITDAKGRFTLKVPEATVIAISYIGYNTAYNKIEKDTFLNIRLSSSLVLKNIVVTAVRKADPNISSVRAIDIEKIPPLGGKPDIIKAIQTLPGIQGTHEGSSVPIIRGGSPGENAYFLDGAPLIYVNHLAGFFSVFNTDMINSIDVYKGGFPAKYGGKLSTIIDIHQNSGNKKEFEAEIGLGITDLSASIQGPIIKDKLSYIITARKTLIDYLLLLTSSISPENNARVLYGFHDINGKLTYLLNDKNTLNLNIYQGDDYLKYWSKSEKNSSKFNNVWGNLLVSGSWATFLGSSLVGNSIVSYTKYRVKNAYEYKLGTTFTDVVDYSTLELYSLKSDWNKTFTSDLNLRFGLQARLNRSIPSATLVKGENISTLNSRYYGTVVSYAEPEYEIGNHLTIYPGIRMSYYNFLRDGKIYLDPRLRIKYKIDRNQSIFSSFMRVHQFEHLFSTRGKIGLNQIWIPADNKIPVASSDQISIGYRNTIIDNFTFSSAIYYKWMRNLSTYKEGYSQILGDPDYYNKIVTDGSGYSYGLELLIRKDKGKWTGSMSYAYIRSFRQFDEVNKGMVFPYDFDRPHNFNILVHRRISKRWEISAGWYFQSGLPYTPTIGKHLVPNQPSFDGSQEFYEVLDYGEKNSGRIKNYHRLDISTTKSKYNKSGELVGELTFGLYNAYAHKNPYYYFYNDKAGSPITTSIYHPKRQEFRPLKRIGVSYFPVIPYIAYTWYFSSGNSRNEIIRSSLSLKNKIEVAHSEERDSTDVSYRYNIKLSYNGDLNLFDNYLVPRYYRIEFNYRFLRYLEGGLQFFYSKQLAFRIESNSMTTSVRRPRYGIGLKATFYPLGLAFKSPPYWIEPYISAKAAFSHLFVDSKKYPYYSHLPLEYGIYGGLNLYLGKYFGFYTEIGRSNLESSENLDVNVGITVRF